MTTLTSKAVRAGGFMVSEANGYRSRAEITVAEGENLRAGAVLGVITSGLATAAVKSGGNTGDGTITASPALETGVVAGVYRLRCVGGTFAASRAAHAGNAGNGVMTLASPAFDGDTVQTGIYRVVCTTAAADGGTFSIFGPDDEFVDTVAVGSAFDGAIKFTIADGSDDFAVGDSILVTVVHAVPTDGGVFSVTAPTGEPLPDATVGTAYTDQLGFTIADGGTDFEVGDGFDVTVVLGLAEYKEYNPDNTDGSEIVAGILWEDTDATSAAKKCAAVVRDCVVNRGELTWFSGASAGEVTAGVAALASLGIVARPSVPA